MDSNAARPISPLRRRMLDDMRARKLARFALLDVCHMTQSLVLLSDCLLVVRPELAQY
jgi:hypothetical protein